MKIGDKLVFIGFEIFDYGDYATINSNPDYNYSNNNPTISKSEARTLKEMLESFTVNKIYDIKDLGGPVAWDNNSITVFDDKGTKWTFNKASQWNILYFFKILTKQEIRRLKLNQLENR